MAISIKQGWLLFFQALTTEKVYSVACASEWMYRLNVFARSVGRHVIADQIYDVKDGFIKYLYEHGYCVEVKLHKQHNDCHGCNGTGESWYGGECRRCFGTGVWSTTELYAFRFDIKGKRYAWHQLKKLVDYPVTLTDAQPGQFTEPKRDSAILKLSDAWLGCCVVWWFLFLHGGQAEFLLFGTTWEFMQTKLGIRKLRYQIATWKSSIKRKWTKLIEGKRPLKKEERTWSDADERIDRMLSIVEEDDIPF